MFLSISYWVLAGLLFASWVLHILLSVKPSKYLDCEWDLIRRVLVAQANRLFYLLLALPFAWVGHNIFIAGFSLMFIVWIIRVYAAFVAAKQAVLLLVGLFTLKDIGGVQTALSNLIVATVSALLAISI